MQKHNRKTAGFTIVEIMVVVVIIGLLAGVVGAGVMGMLSNARINTTKAQISNIETALKFYKMEKGSYPTTSQGIKALTQKGKSGEPFLPQVPVDAWGNEFIYKLKGSEYDIISYGADGREGGEGEDGDIKASDTKKAN